MKSMQSLHRLHNCNLSFFLFYRHKCYYCDYEGKQIQRVIDHSCSCHPNEILKIRSLELNATSGKQGFRTKDMHVIPAEILNGHNKILIHNIASELIVIENAVDQNDIDDNEEMEDLQESLLNLSVEMIQNLHESPYAKKSKTALHSVPSTIRKTVNRRMTNKL